MECIIQNMGKALVEYQYENSSILDCTHWTVSLRALTVLTVLTCSCDSLLEMAFCSAHSCFSQWLHQLELLCVSRELEELWTQRLQRRAFSLWQLRLSRARSHLHHTRRWRDMRQLRLYLSVWRERLDERKRARLCRLRQQTHVMCRMRNTLLCWRTAFSQRLRSRDHCTQTQQRRWD